MTEIPQNQDPLILSPILLIIYLDFLMDRPIRMPNPWIYFKSFDIFFLDTIMLTLEVSDPVFEVD